jgi:(p)ppGpp synthase/HD superfamily hydrolase
MNINQDMITKAWFLASKAHQNQKFPGSEMPYLTHIGNVMMEIFAVSHTLENPELAITCAILHDTIEDTDVSYDTLEQSFSKEVANGVMALTKNENLVTKKAKMLDSLKRIKMQPEEIWVAKMADRVANLGKPPHYWSQEKIEAYQEEARLILEHLGSANSIIAKRLEEKIDAYGKYVV